ncbi:MAG: hypothetical protein ACP5P3_08580 [Ignavibacteria bacterium]
MKNPFFINVIFLILSGFLFFGCPYNSEVPIDPIPTVPVIKDLFGIWAENDSASKRYTLEPDGDFMYAIKELQLNSTTGNYEQFTEYSAYLSNIEGTIFLNVKEKEDFNNVFYTSNYYFYKLQVFRDSVILIPVTEYIREKFDNSGDLRLFFSANMKNSYFYAQEQKYFRITQ